MGRIRQKLQAHAFGMGMKTILKQMEVYTQSVNADGRKVYAEYWQLAGAPHAAPPVLGRGNETGMWN
jgi:hypothetical protein